MSLSPNPGQTLWSRKEGQDARMLRHAAMNFAIQCLQSGVGDNANDVVANAAIIEDYLAGKQMSARQSAGGMITAQPGIIVADNDKRIEPDEPLGEPSDELSLADMIAKADYDEL